MQHWNPVAACTCTAACHLPDVGRGPCRRPLCGHPEYPDHDHGWDGTRTHCTICGSAGCGSYRAPSTRPCGRCGTPGNTHPALTGTDALNEAVCGGWVRPPPRWIQVLSRLATGHRPL